MCGLCLSLRDNHGHVARIATNHDGLVVSLLVEAQSALRPARKAAGRCPLRGMRRADVAAGECVRLAAVVSLVLAAARVRDHADDRDGIVGTLGVRSAARRVANRWVRQASDAGHDVGFDTAVLVAAMDRQACLETTLGPGGSPLSVTEPTETAVGAAFAHTAVLAGRPANEAPLREIGQLFGRLAHLIDAVEDYRDDVAAGRWNPLAASQTPFDEVRRLCDDAALGIELALAEVEFSDGRLVHRLLTREVRRAVSRAFRQAGATAHTGCSHGRVKAVDNPDQPLGAGYRYLDAEGEGPDEGPDEGDDPENKTRRRKDRDSGCWCCCDGCDCCCTCDDCCCACDDCCCDCS